MRHILPTTFALAILILWSWIKPPCLAQSGSPSLLWSAPVPVKRVAKPRRTPPPVHLKTTVKKSVVQRVPLLSLRWNMSKGAWADVPDATRKPIVVSPETAFKVNDHVQLVLEVNQDGYLYVIQDSDLTM